MNGINLPRNVVRPRQKYVRADDPEDFDIQLTQALDELSGNPEVLILNIDIKQPITDTRQAFAYNAFILYTLKSELKNG